MTLFHIGRNVYRGLTFYLESDGLDECGRSMVNVMIDGVLWAKFADNHTFDRNIIITVKDYIRRMSS